MGIDEQQKPAMKALRTDCRLWLNDGNAVIGKFWSAKRNYKGNFHTEMDV
jgi:hypothetical protein